MREGLELHIYMRFCISSRSLLFFSAYLQSSQQRGDPGAPPLYATLSQAQQQREPVEHLEEQHRKGSFQGGHAGTAQRAHQHPPEAV